MSMTAHERRLCALYLLNASNFFDHREREARDLAEWVANRKSGDRFGDRRWRRDEDIPEYELGNEPFRRRWSSLRNTLRKEYLALKRTRRDRTARRVWRLGEAMGLVREEIDILELLLRYHTQPLIESMVDDIFSIRRSIHLNIQGTALPALLGVSANAIQARLSKEAPLIRSGLVTVESDGDLRIVGRLSRLATAPDGAGPDVHHLLLDAAHGSELVWEDFDHVARDRDYIERMVTGALDTGAPGVNVLLYGPPGTGKTEFGKVLAQRLGVSLYMVGESDDEGGEPTRGERLQELRLGQRLLAGQRGSLLLFDEMEDLLADSAPWWGLFGRASRSRYADGGSKVYLHRLLEEAPTPTLWTMNDARDVSPAILRRFTFALELRRPTPGVRTRIWAQQLERLGIEAGADDARKFATDFDVTPGVAAGAIRGARLAGGGIAEVHRSVGNLSRVMGCEKPPQGPPPRFDLALIRADVDPATLVEQLASRGERHFSLCVAGASGTGKSAFVRYLAERLGLEVLQKRASDLMSPYVGETEQQIAAAFAEARDQECFLVFDEADSLLADRRFAQRSWEVSQVNEMLTWMESHPLPFACTTNFGEHLDPATLRRFVFKVTLDYLTPAQAEAAFRSYFELAPPAGLTGLDALTPGDFAVVHRKATVLGRMGEPETLVGMLRAERDAKPDRPRRTIGFLN